MQLDLKRPDERATLELAFDEFQMTLIPGSKNDLLQAFEQHPDVAQRKKMYILAMTAPRDATATRQSK